MNLAERHFRGQENQQQRTCITDEEESKPSKLRVGSLGQSGMRSLKFREKGDSGSSGNFRDGR